MNHRVFIFRRDLRVVDNIGLFGMESTAVAPIFIFNVIQIDPTKNPYFSSRAFDFMIESLRDLSRDLPELRFYMTRSGDDLDVLKEIAPHTVYFNKDLTPFARKRDDAIQKRYVTTHGFQGDYSLVDPETMEKPYRVFTPFYKKYLGTIIIGLETLEKPLENKFVICPPNSYSVTLEEISTMFPREILKKTLIGGRRNGLKIIERIKNGEFGDYDTTRDDPNSKTTLLSPYIKFGCVSCREVFSAVESTHGRNHGLIRELFWRAFYYEVQYHFPWVLNLKKNQKNSTLRVGYGEKWKTRESIEFVEWTLGKTRVPFVDAGMRELIQTGHMHNRLRMITASYLVKDLGFDWRMGEKFFARNLVDYDPASNSGGWQWVAGCGADAQPWSRKFSPWIQAQKHDKECRYIKKHVKELAGVPVEEILWGLRPHTPCQRASRPLDPLDSALKAPIAKGAYS